ncbi:hypothetical protein MMC07_002119 [Pseudocyphellaria aurata]|nr:hypothetical protein [Pseudocyphellaria aurata]
MTHKLPPNLLALFAARPALRYLPPNDHAPEDRKTHNIGGVAQYLSAMKDYEQIPFEPTESWLQRKDRLKLEKKERQQKLLSEGLSQNKATDDPQVRGDAFKTLFVARLSYDTTEKDLRREFERFGPIERIRIVTDTHDILQTEVKSKKKKKTHRGYAFVPPTKKPMESASKTAVFLSTSREAAQSKAGGLAVWVEALVVEVTQRLCQLDQQHQVGSLLPPDQAASTAVDSVVDLEVGAVPDPPAVFAEVSAEVIVEALAAEEEGLATKEVVVSAEEAVMVGHRMDLVMVRRLLLMLPLAQGELEEASGLALVGTLVHLLTAVQPARLLPWTDRMLLAVGMAIQGVMAHMTTDPRIAEVPAAVGMATELIEVTAAQEASRVVIVSR